MNDTEKTKLSQVLRELGINPSYHRLLILDELRKRQDHPSAEQLYRTLSPLLPTLSRTTVYNTLGLFAGRNLIRCLAVGQELHYDHDLQDQVHYYCLACRRIIDPPQPVDLPLPDDAFAGFRVDQIQTIVKGLCPACRNDENTVKETNDKNPRRRQP